jgi:hypothetical protein
MNRLTAMAGVVTAMLMGCGAGAEVGFEANGAEATAALVTDRVVMKFHGFEPGARVTVRASTADGAVSFATFLADAEGRFDTAQAPLAGSYAGADADGLFYSMTGRVPEFVTHGELSVTVSAEVAGNEVLRQKFERAVRPELLPVPSRDLCGGLPCPERKTSLLPQDPIPMPSSAARASAGEDDPESAPQFGPRTVGPVPRAEELAASAEEVVR